MESESLLSKASYGGIVMRRRRGYKKMKIVGLRRSPRRYWRIRRLRWVITSPLKMLTKLKNAYINLMLRLAGSVGAMNTETDSNTIFALKRIPKARQVSKGYSMDAFEARLIFEISKSLVASYELYPINILIHGYAATAIEQNQYFALVMETVQSKADADSFWTWNKNDDQRQFSITKLLGNKPPKPQTSVLGPGFGAGIGCGAGIGFGLVGSFGYGGWPFNHLNLVFGLGMGCGIGLGYGFGQGIGYNFHFRTRKSRKSNNNFSDSNKTIVIQI
ncbi:hypothetical protein RJT34_18672 [Clitoria ternatea]|uniref:Uncharacterized protein n=1 Tax=Clitoria ternatea TaxID=43366 RepID=A0AAN9PE83_CLITE